ncbi:MAG TPA: citramalate synthase, partial [Verrucomicrobiae bacterium]|jgi:2-isopropylmalate synthase|nr:citramalate synthase [Verrucomicrobiae bacterium]
MKPEVEIYDTTLRDGSQGEGVNFSVMDKLRIAEKLDAFGVHYIEGGWPGSNPKDIEFFNEAKRRKFKNARLAAFGSTRKKGVRVERDDQVRLLIDAGTPVVTIYGKTSMLHVKEVLRCTPEENLAMIGDTVRFLKDHGKFVIYDAEHCFDGYKLDPEYAIATWQAAEKAGADFVVLCDTNGGCLPSEVSEITKVAVGKLNCKVGIHSHDDIGLGVANALAAIESGAVHVQGTINGYGERTGNCNLTSVIPCVSLKMKKRSVPAASLAKLKDLSQFVDEIANIRHNPRLPWVGSAAFAHKGGTHVNAVQKLASSYEHIDPKLVGNARNILISDLAGRSNIVMKARELGFKLQNDTPELKQILTAIKQREHDGYEYEAAEGSMALLIRSVLEHNPELSFAVDTYHVSMRRDKKESICEATVRVRVGDKTAHTVAEGYGPVNALDAALRRALVNFFPKLKGVELTDYKVRIINGTTGTAAKTRVLITSSDSKREWGTVGVSTNIIEASLQALVDSLEYGLLRKKS